MNRSNYEWAYDNRTGVRYLRSARHNRVCGSVRAVVENLTGRGIDATVLAFAAVVIAFLLLLR